MKFYEILALRPIKADPKVKKWPWQQKHSIDIVRNTWVHVLFVYVGTHVPSHAGPTDSHSATLYVWESQR